MATHTYSIANQTFPATRADINNALAAVRSSNSQPADPAGASVPGQIYYHTGEGVLKIYNGTSYNRVGHDPSLPLDISNITSATSATTGALKVLGGISTQENLVVGGNLAVTGVSTMSGAVTISTSGTGLTVTNNVSVGGSLTGNVTGALTGNVTGDVTGDVTGALTGNVTGNVTGDITGAVTGDVTGNVTGNLLGELTGVVSEGVTLKTSGFTADPSSEGPVFVLDSSSSVGVGLASASSNSGKTVTIIDKKHNLYWMGSIVWAGGISAPNGTVGVDIYKFFSDGTDWYGTPYGIEYA